MTTDATALDEILARFPDLSRPTRTTSQHEQIIGQMTIHYEPDLHVHLKQGDGHEVAIRLRGDALERALLFDGELAMATVLVTLLDGDEVDRIVGVVNPGKPLTGREFVAAIDAITADMTQEEREELADAIDPRWRNNR